MGKFWYSFASYNLWLHFAPPVGREHWHCDMKRGFVKARAKEAQVAKLLTLDSKPQRIGTLAQRGVYEFHQNPSNAVEKVAEILQLEQELPEVRDKVILILKNYYEQPILANKNIIELKRGDETFPQPILVKQGNYEFNLYAAIDCIFVEPDETIHILDFKTGKTDFDKRQAYVYLVAAQYLFPQRKTVASFYNLETNICSESISATSDALESIKIELASIAKRHQKELKKYSDNPENFQQIFPPNPGLACQYCNFGSVCEFSSVEVSA